MYVSLQYGRMAFAEYCEYKLIINQSINLEVERKKWESREVRLAAQLDEAMQQIAMLKERQSVAGENIKGDELEMVESVVSPTASHAPSEMFSLVDRNETLSETNLEVSKPVVTTEFHPSPVPMLNQLPPITRFSGEEQPDGETFQDWLEQFESVAQLGGWNNHAKLVNLSTMQTTRFSLFVL